MKIIDRKNLQIIEADIEAALGAIARKHGISLKIGRGKYSNASYGSFGIDIATIGDNGVVETVEARDFRSMASYYGFQPDDLGRTFFLEGRTFTLTGLKARAGKRPILATCGGKQYVFPETVARLIKRDAVV
jgi:hypothetical protein